VNSFAFLPDEKHLRLSTGPGLLLSDALLLSMLSALAYADDRGVAAVLPELGLDLVAYFDHGDSQGFAAATDRELIFSFRGTAQPGDWITNLDMRRVRTPNGRVHRGFLTALDHVWSDIEGVIDKERGARTFWFTGHSLGGALATLAAARCALERQIPVAGLQTFGQPRVGNRKFAVNLERVLANRYFRFMNHADTVPGLPSAWRFRHAGQMCWFDKRGALILPTGMEGWDTRTVRAGKFTWEIPVGGDLFRTEKSYRDGKWHTDTDTVGDHSIETCRGLLRQALQAGREPTKTTARAARLLRDGPAIRTP
jgi:triacylglycerol lipase